MQRSLTAGCALALTLASTVCFAESLDSEVHAAYSGDDVVRLTTGWGKHAGARLQIGKAKAVVLDRGAAAGALAAGHDHVIAAFAVDDAAKPFRVVAIAGGKAGKPIAIARPTDRHDIPFAVAATETPDGFAVFFQEAQTDDPSAAHTYLIALDKDGNPQGAAVEVAVPWSLAGAAWNGTGYHLALIYADAGGGGMRLSMVSLTRDGQPEQHPDWASRAGYVADVHLVAADGVIHAFYRGAGGDKIVDADVTKIGNWGTEPAKAKILGALPSNMVIAIKAGRPTKVRQ